jgi:hypothetical protein
MLHTHIHFNTPIRRTNGWSLGAFKQRKCSFRWLGAIGQQTKLVVFCLSKDTDAPIPVQTWTDPKGSGMLRLPDFMKIGAWRWYVCQLYAPAAFTHSENIIGTHFCQRLIRTHDYSAAGRIIVKEEFHWHHWESNPRHPTCSAVPQPTEPPRAPFKEVNTMNSDLFFSWNF